MTYKTTNMDSSKYDANCTICNELIGNNSVYNSNYSEIVKSKRNIIFETNNFAVLPALGPLNEYHLLIVPKFHVTSYAKIDNQIMIELFEIKKSIEETNRGLNKKTISFEHGSNENFECSSACIEHAHIHILGVDRTYFQEITCLSKFYEITYEEIDKLYDTNYFLYEDIDSKLIYTIEPLPSQFMRMIYCLFTSKEEWNWRSNHKIETVKKIIENYSDKIFS